MRDNHHTVVDYFAEKRIQVPCTYPTKKEVVPLRLSSSATSYTSHQWICQSMLHPNLHLDCIRDRNVEIYCPERIATYSSQARF